MNGRGLGGSAVLALAVALSGCGEKRVPTLPEKVVGTCLYTNNFSRGQECRDYHGEWTEKQAQDDCRSWTGEFSLGGRCDLGELYGHCILNGPGEGLYARVSTPGSDASRCGSAIRGCELFGGGVFDPQPICGGTIVDTGTGLDTFRWPVRTCKAPMPGEQPGRNEGGQVCTWEMISGATEPGRNFADYASCDRVRTQRPYYSAPPNAGFDRVDPRLQDPTYAAELAWVKKEIRATACVCCHMSSAPRGASNWSVDGPENFLNGFYDRGLAMGAGWIDTVGFGAFPPEENNGFSRATPERPNDSIFVTTDPARMKRFFEAELAFRGKTKADFAGQVYGAGPLDDQRFFKPQACKNGEGIQADGTVVWNPTSARYVYVMEATSSSPGVPPNLDLPQGTVWRFDVPEGGSAVASGTVRYGQTPAGTIQRFPTQGSPEPLKRGKQYYLYVLQDIAIPVARCLFTAP